MAVSKYTTESTTSVNHERIIHTVKAPSGFDADNMEIDIIITNEGISISLSNKAGIQELSADF